MFFLIPNRLEICCVNDVTTIYFCCIAVFFILFFSFFFSILALLLLGVACIVVHILTYCMRTRTRLATLLS